MQGQVGHHRFPFVNEFLAQRWQRLQIQAAIGYCLKEKPRDWHTLDELTPALPQE